MKKLIYNYQMKKKKMKNDLNILLIFFIIIWISNPSIRILQRYKGLNFTYCLTQTIFFILTLSLSFFYFKKYKYYYIMICLSNNNKIVNI